MKGLFCVSDTATKTRHLCRSHVCYATGFNMTRNSRMSGTSIRTSIRSQTDNMAHPVDNGHSVVEAEGEEEWPTEGDTGQQYVSDPLSALHLGIV